MGMADPEQRERREKSRSGEICHNGCKRSMPCSEWVSPDGKSFVTTSRSPSIRCLESGTCGPVRAQSLEYTPTPSGSPCFRHDGQLLAIPHGGPRRSRYGRRASMRETFQLHILTTGRGYAGVFVRQRPIASYSVGNLLVWLRIGSIASRLKAHERHSMPIRFFSYARILVATEASIARPPLAGTKVFRCLAKCGRDAGARCVAHLFRGMDGPRRRPRTAWWICGVSPPAARSRAGERTPACCPGSRSQLETRCCDCISRSRHAALATPALADTDR